MGSVGPWEIALIVLVLLLVFGPKRLPGIGRSLGRGLREFKESVTDQTRELKEATIDAPKEFKAALNPLADAPKQPAEPATAPVAATPAAVVVAEESEPVAATPDAPAAVNGSEPSH